MLRDERRERIAKLAACAAGIVLGLLMVEVLARVRAYLIRGITFEQAMTHPLEIPKNRHPGLGGIIRLSRNPQIVYELKPNLSVVFPYEGNDVTTNAEGFRSKEHPVEKSARTFRIVGIGDSMMFGMGVADNQDYLSLLEARLNASFPQRNWETINTGVPGYNTVMEVETLKEKGLRYHPDLVVLGWCDNDLGLPFFIMKTPDYFTLKKSFALNFARRTLHQKPAILDVLGGTQEWVGVEPDPAVVPAAYKGMVGWQGVDGALRELADMGKRDGFQIVIVSFSLLDQLVPRLRNSGLPILDVGPIEEEYARTHNFADIPHSNLVVNSHDYHPSPLAHQIASDALFDYVRTRYEATPQKASTELVTGGAAR